MLEYCKRRLFPGGNPLYSLMSLSKEDFRRAGEVMAMSIVQGGPAPNFLSPEIYTVLSRSFKIEDCKDAFLKETCLKLKNASSEEIVELLVNEEVLEILQTIGYNGVLSKENKDTVNGIIKSICMHDQTPEESMPSILQLEEGLKTYDLLDAVRRNPEMWRPVFTPDVSSELTASSLLGQMVFNFSLPQILKEKEIDVQFHFTKYLPSLNTAGLEALLKWATGSTTIPPLGLPRKIKVEFLHGCPVGCCCRPTSSTCDLSITIPSHLDNDDAMKNIFASAIGDSAGFGKM